MEIDENLVLNNPNLNIGDQLEHDDEDAVSYHSYLEHDFGNQNTSRNVQDLDDESDEEQQH